MADGTTVSGAVLVGATMVLLAGPVAEGTTGAEAEPESVTVCTQAELLLSTGEAGAEGEDA